jgi:hypothetical protein
VLVFFDPTSGGHPLDQDNLATSPWIDLAAAGVADLGGKVLQFDGYFDLPLANYVYLYVMVKTYPQPCALPWDFPPCGLGPCPSPYMNFGGAATCPHSASGPGVTIDLSDQYSFDPGTQAVKIGIGVANLCSFYGNCDGQSNTTPWIDNVRFGVFANATTAVPGDRPGASAFLLGPAFPNPFRSGQASTIEFSLAEDGPVSLVVYDLAGRRCRTLLAGRATAGPHRASWDGRDDSGRPVAAGIYLYRVNSAAGDLSRKVVVMP